MIDTQLEEDRFYTLTLSPTQAGVLADSCLLSAEVEAGNIECMGKELLEHGGPDAQARREAIEEAKEILEKHKHLAEDPTPQQDSPSTGGGATHRRQQKLSIHHALTSLLQGAGGATSRPATDPTPPYAWQDGGIHLTLDYTQGRLAVNALDFLSRVHLGQLDTAYWLLVGSRPRERLEALQLLKKVVSRDVNPLVTGMQQNAYWGISSPKISDRARIAFDIQQVLRHCVSWDVEPSGGITVDFNSPLRVSVTEALPRAEVGREPREQSPRLRR